MDTRELRKLTRQFGSVVILEEDKPAFIIIAFNKYKPEYESAFNALDSRAADQSEFQDPQDLEIIERLNNEILALKEEIRLKEQEQPETPIEEGLEAKEN